jgi:hypothetical protein
MEGTGVTQSIIRFYFSRSISTGQGDKIKVPGISVSIWQINKAIEQKVSRVKINNYLCLFKLKITL